MHKIKDEVLSLVNPSKDFIYKFTDVINDFAKYGKWFIHERQNILYIYRPLEMISSTADEFKIKCFVCYRNSLTVE